MKTGNTGRLHSRVPEVQAPQWSPVMKTGNTYNECYSSIISGRPQWSPVMKTGNTCTSIRDWPASGSLNGARS